MPPRIIHTVEQPSTPNFRLRVIEFSGSTYVQFQAYRNSRWSGTRFKILRLDTVRQHQFLGAMSGTRIETVNRLVYATTESDELNTNNILLTGRNSGFYIHEITRQSIRFSSMNISSIDRVYVPSGQLNLNPSILRANYTNTVGYNSFLSTMYIERLSFTSWWLDYLAIIVAMGVGISFAIGMGPAAGVCGLGSSLTGTAAGATIGITQAQAALANAICGALASAFINFLRGCFSQMTSIVQSNTNLQRINRQLADPSLSTARRTALERQRGQLIVRDSQQTATRFWEHNSDGITDVIINALVSGVFSFGTSYIPGGTGLNTRSDLTLQNISTVLRGRLANNFTSVIESIFSDIAQGNSINWNSIESGLLRNLTMRGIG